MKAKGKTNDSTKGKARIVYLVKKRKNNKGNQSDEVGKETMLENIEVFHGDQDCDLERSKNLEKKNKTFACHPEEVGVFLVSDIAFFC